MTKQISIAFAVALYLAGASYTFGEVWHRVECSYEESLPDLCEEAKVFKSLLSSAFWPFAISVILQDGEAA